MARTAEPEQLTGEVIQLGTVVSVDHGTATCTVDVGDLITGELPWLASRAGSVKVWSPPTVGEQCVVFCPEGDLAGGLVLPGLWSTANPAPSSDPNLVMVKFPDGAWIGYDPAGHALTATLPAGGTAEVTAPGGITLNADVTVNGTITATGDVIADGISLKSHKHTGVASGAAQTGDPV